MKNTINHVAFDVHADSNQVAIASPDGEVRDYGAIGSRLSDVVMSSVCGRALSAINAKPVNASRATFFATVVATRERPLGVLLISTTSR